MFSCCTFHLLADPSAEQVHLLVLLHPEPGCGLFFFFNCYFIPHSFSSCTDLWNSCLWFLGVVSIKRREICVLCKINIWESLKKETHWWRIIKWKRLPACFCSLIEIWISLSWVCFFLWIYFSDHFSLLINLKHE